MVSTLFQFFAFTALAGAAALPPNLASNGFKDSYNYLNILAARKDLKGGHDPDVDRSFWANVSSPVLLGAGNGAAPTYFYTQPDPQFYLDKIFDGELLLVVHADQRFDEKSLSKVSIEKLQREFASKLNPIVHLYDLFPSTTWFAQGAPPTQSQISHGGENSIRFRSGRLTLVGGFWGECHTIALLDVIRQHFWVSREALRIVIPTDAIYAHDADYQPTRLAVIAGSNRLAFIQNDIVGFFHEDWAAAIIESNPVAIPVGRNLDLNAFTLRFHDMQSGQTSTSGSGKQVVEFEIR